MPFEQIALMILLWLAGFSALWIGITLLVSFAGGWRRLARRFPAAAPPPWPGETFGFQSVMIGWFGRYSLCINVTLGGGGVYLKPIVLYAIGHPPIFVPWERFAGASFGRFVVEYCEVDLGGTKLRIGGGCVAKIRERMALQKGCG